MRERGELEWGRGGEGLKDFSLNFFLCASRVACSQVRTWPTWNTGFLIDLI